MKIRITLVLFIALCALFVLPSCNKGYGCEATEKMKSPYDKKNHKKKKRKRNKGKTQSGLMGYQLMQSAEVYTI